MTTKKKSDTKNIFQSKTFWGVIVMLIGVYGGQWFGFNLTEATQSVISEELVTIAGAFLTIYGRVKADTKVSGVL
jgi:hypothetical protein